MAVTGTVGTSPHLVRTSAYLFKVNVINQCESASITAGAALTKDYAVIPTPANPQLSFYVGSFTTNPLGCPLNYKFDVSPIPPGCTVATGV